MRIVQATNEDIMYVLGRLHLNYSPSMIGISAISDSGKLYCCCLIIISSESCVIMHIVVDNPIGLKNNTFFKESFNYIFNTADKLTASVFVPEDNEKSVKFCKKIGFNEIARIPDGASAGKDTLVMVMQKDTCKWIAGSNDNG